MKNPLRNRILAHIPIWAVMKAEADLESRGYEIDRASTDVLYLTELRERGIHYTAAARETTYAQPDNDRPAVRPPALVPAIYPSSAFTIAASVEIVGTIRGLHLVAHPRGGYSLTLKITIPGKGHFYRYGRLLRADQLEEVISRWLAKGYWTPDKQ